MRRFDAAPWSTTVKIASTVATAVFAAITLGIPRTVPHAGGAAFAGAALASPARRPGEPA